MGKLLAIDGLGIVRRVYQANPDPDTPEKAESALRFAQLSFRKLLTLHQPSHVLAAFDHGGPTWRHDLYPRYKEGREQMPEPLRAGLPGFYAKLEEIGLKAVSPVGVEADDAIATGVLRWLNEQRGEAVVVSTDKDLHQLVAHGARVWDHFKGEWHDRAWVEKKFGVEPERLTDLIALMGDAADGIPGVAKIGIKTAARLLQAYGSLEGVMAGAGILMDPMGERLRRDRDQAFLSRQLAQLKDDVQLGVTWNMLAFDVRWIA
ncbi:MAG: 5'-3' exonuclease [Burkholderiaceae bacterium]|nr:5'-3' exonuclease [Burkholderiaceae bacterium]